MNNMVLEPNKEYNHNDSVVLLNEVRDLFQGKLKMVGIEWKSDKKKVESKNESESTIFIINKSEKPLFEDCNGMDDVSRIFMDFEESLVRLADGIYAIVDNNKSLDKDSVKSLESYGSAIDKAVTVFGNQKKRRMPKINEMSSVGELRDEIKQFFSEIIANYVVTVLVDALYIRIKSGTGEVYELVLNEVNKFLAENGVITKEVSIGEQLNPEYLEPTQDSAENFTDEFAKYDTIEEIRRYPYFFNDGTKILDGMAKIWRRKD